MTEPSEESAKLAIQYGITIFQALRKLTENVNESMMATSAVLQTMVEKFPELAEKYEKHYKESQKTSPLAATSGSICAEFERIEKQLASLIK